MQRFLFLFVGLASPPEDDSVQTRDYRQSWVAWMAELASKGILESGLPLAGSGKVVKKDAVADLSLQREDIGGYLLIRANSLDEAVEIAQQAPHMALGGTTFVRPCLEVNR